jgi:uracil phosphoribosyltransferase
LNTVLTLSSKTVRLRRSDPPVRQSIAVDAVRPATPATNNPVASNLAPAPAVVAPPAAKKINIAEHPFAQHALMALRNKHTEPAQFRQISNQLLVLLALEATRSLPTKDELIETHSTTHTGQVLAKPVIFLSVSRHGLGLTHGVADFFPGMLVGNVTLERKGDNPGVEPRLHVVNAPALSDARVILFDPVVATGMSSTLALNFIRRSGATDITLVSFLVSFPGLSRLQASSPELSVWTAGIDSEWDSKRGPMPGLGNFAERLYG